MTTLHNRPNTALLVVDAQIGVLADAIATDAVVANICELVAKAREANVHVVWVQQTDDDIPKGTHLWGLAAGLDPQADETRIEKRYGDSFEGTPLESILHEHGVGRLVVAGAQTDACIRATLHGANTRGYDTTLVGDAHTTEDLTTWGAPTPELVIAHTNMYWADHDSPGRTANVVVTKENVFA